MTDWLRAAKDRDERGDANGDGWVMAAALIAIAEELRKINERAEADRAAAAAYIPDAPDDSVIDVPPCPSVACGQPSGHLGRCQP